MSYTLYRMRDRRGVLLYVGQSIRLPQRVTQHRRDKLWWETVSDIELEHFRSQRALDDAERKAIILESPLHNKIWSCMDFSPRLIPATHVLMTAEGVKQRETEHWLGTDGLTLAKALRAGILERTDQKRLTSKSVIQMWISVAPIGTLLSQAVLILSAETMSARAKAMCWRIGNHIAYSLGEEDRLNWYLGQHALPEFPWKMSPGRL